MSGYTHNGLGVANQVEHKGLHNNLAFTKGCDRQYSKEFAVTGAKIGNTINIRKPNSYYVSDGATLHVQDTVEDYTSLTLDHQFHVDVNFTTADLALSLDDFSSRILEPAMAKLASKVDQTGLQTAYLKVFNQVGTPGTVPGTSGTGSALTLTTSPYIWTNAGRMLNEYCAPQSQRSIVLNPAAMANAVASFSGFYNAQGEISKQFMNGYVGRAYGFDFAMDQNIQALTNGDRSGYSSTTTETVGASSEGDNEITVDGWTAAVHTVMKAGERFTLDGIYSVNPETGQSTGELAMFVCMEDVITDGSGSATFEIYPPLRASGSTATKPTVSALPANNTDLNPLSGTLSTAYPCNVAYHKNAFTLGTADLEMPQGVHFAARESYDGISMRVVRQYDINSDSIPCRIDILCGWACPRPEWACIICG